jgi:hypothetical protein
MLYSLHSLLIQWTPPLVQIPAGKPDAVTGQTTAQAQATQTIKRLFSSARMNGMT